MASSKTRMANLSVAHLGISKEIGNLETESSAAAQVCRLFFDEALKATLGDFPWSFANKTAALSLIEADPNDEWGYSYQYPTDCISPIKIWSGVRVDTRDSEVKFETAHGDSGRVIYTDQDDAILKYTKYVTDVSRYPASFVLAFSFRLAAYIAPSLTGGDPYKLGDRAMKMYLNELSVAKDASVKENKRDVEPDSEFISGR